MEDWLSSFNSVLSNPTVANLTGSLFGSSKAPPKPSAPAIVSVPSAPAVPTGGMSQSTMLMIGGGVLALVAVLFVAFKK